MPVYDCGAPDCEECQRAFGPNRSSAIAEYNARDAYYAKLEREAFAKVEPKDLNSVPDPFVGEVG